MSSALLPIPPHLALALFALRQIARAQERVHGRLPHAPAIAPAIVPLGSSSPHSVAVPSAAGTLCPRRNAWREGTGVSGSRGWPCMLAALLRWDGIKMGGGLLGDPASVEEGKEDGGGRAIEADVA